MENNEVIVEVNVEATEKKPKNKKQSRYSREQVMLLICATAFLVGGLFMLVNVFAGYEWAFYTGLGIMFAVTAVMVWQYYGNKKTVKKNLEETSTEGQIDETKPEEKTEDQL